LFRIISFPLTCWIFLTSASPTEKIDELLTPDSSRFWLKDDYRPGGPQKSFDKQFLRDYLFSIRWNKTSPAPELPEEVVDKTREKYLEAYEKLVGKALGGG
jgi:phosphoribosylaminoimidazole-succinocarboxamide synthase